MFNVSTTLTFNGLGIAPKVLEVLNKMKFTTPTPIQHKAIPVATEGQDVMGVAQTGTGKTLAFAIPMVQRLAQNPGIGLVLVPTRELAIQVEETFQKIAPVFGIKTVVLIGGAPMFEQLKMLRRGPRVIVATPGRLLDHMERRTADVSHAHILVLDEADRMFDMGFQPQIEQILRSVPKDRQTMLFSATIPREIMALASRHMKLPIHIEIAPSGTVAENVEQELYVVRHEAKPRLLGKVLEQYRGSVLLFSRTKHGARKIARIVRDLGHSSAEIHSDKTLGQRRAALEGFKVGRHRVLVATDIASRGIDVKGIELVINYDLPDDAENYIHRIGRTGRAGMGGRAISFATPDQASEVQSIEKIMRVNIPVVKHPDVPAEEFFVSARPSGGRPVGRSFSRGRSFGGRSFTARRRR